MDYGLVVNTLKEIIKNNVPDLGASYCTVDSVDTGKFTLECTENKTGNKFYGVRLVTHTVDIQFPHHLINGYVIFISQDG